MTKRTILILLGLLLALLTTSALAEEPVVFYQGNTVAQPGNVIGIRGEYLDKDWTASITDGTKTANIDLIQQGKQSFKFIIPEDFAQGLYTLTLSGEQPLTITLNAPVVRWMQGDEGDIVTNGGWVRLQGECLRITEEAAITLTLAGENGSVTLTPERVYDDYSVGFRVGDLPHGQYAAAYSNGFASCDAGTLTIGPSPMDKYAKDVYNVLDYGMDNTGVKTVDAVLNAVLTKVKENGGGVIYFPKGRYQLTGTIDLPKGVILRGDGMDETQLFWMNAWRTYGFDENNQLTWMPDTLPKAMIISRGDMAIEEMEFYLGRSGDWLHVGEDGAPVEGNVTLKGVRVFQNSYLGLDYSHTAQTEKVAEEHNSWREMLTFRVQKNVKLIGCDFTWNDKVFGVQASDSEHAHYSLIQDCYFGKEAWAPYYWHEQIIEDTEFDGCTVGPAGHNVYFARTTHHDTQGGDREGLTTDGGYGMAYCGPVKISADGLTYTFPADTNMAKVRAGKQLLIAYGTGAGQSRTVTKVEGTTVTISEPFAVQPDAASALTVNPLWSNWYMVDMSFENTGAFQFYVSTANVVVDGASFKRATGVKSTPQQVYETFAVNWYMSFLNCKYTDGNFYHTSGWMNYHPYAWTGGNMYSMGMPTADDNKRSEPVPGYSFLWVFSRNEGLKSIATTLRNNTLDENCIILIASEGDPEDKNIENIIIDGNRVANADAGIYIHGEIEDVYLHNNTFENVKEDVVRVKSWIFEGDRAYYDAMWGEDVGKPTTPMAEKVAQPETSGSTKPAVTPTACYVTYVGWDSRFANPNLTEFKVGGKDIELIPPSPEYRTDGFQYFADEQGNPITVIDADDARDRTITVVTLPKPDVKVNGQYIIGEVFKFVCQDDPSHVHYSNECYVRYPISNGKNAFAGWNYDTNRWEVGIRGTAVPEGHKVVDDSLNYSSVEAWYDGETGMWIPFRTPGVLKNYDAETGVLTIYVTCK